MQLTSEQCPDRKPGTAPEVRELLEQLYPAMVMNIATSNVDGGNITVSMFILYFPPVPCSAVKPSQALRHAAKYPCRCQALSM